MRRKLNAKEKRKHIIGIKVKEEIKEKIEYIAEAEAKTKSTYLNELLEKHINDYFLKNKINWELEKTNGGMNEGNTL